MFGFKIFFLLILLSLYGCGSKKSDENDRTKINNNKAKTETDGFIFVGMYDYYPGLYKYDITAKKYKVFWSVQGEKVIELSYSDDRKAAFFITAQEYGKRGVFPFVKEVKLYRIDIDSSKVHFVKKIGSGLQLFTEWEVDDSFKVILNSLNKTVANYIDQQTEIFSKYGKELINKTKIYDITKEGYPRPPEPKDKTASPDGRYKIVSETDSSTTKIFVDDLKNQNKYLFASANQKLNNVEWYDNDNYVIFSTLDISPHNETIYSRQPNTSKIFIGSVKEKKLVKTWEGSGVKNFFIIRNILVFDDGFKDNSTIHLYNLKTSTSVDSIKIQGGCGIINIPEIPDYSV
jgi:hypothetical protein